MHAVSNFGIRVQSYFRASFLHRFHSSPHLIDNAMENRPSKRTARPEPTCKDEVALIADYLAGALNPPVLAAFERHVGQCPDCMAFLRTYKKTIEATRAFMKMSSLKTVPLSLRLSPRAAGIIATFLLWLHLFTSNDALTLQ